MYFLRVSLSTCGFCPKRPYRIEFGQEWYRYRSNEELKMTLKPKRLALGPFAVVVGLLMAPQLWGQVNVDVGGFRVQADQSGNRSFAGQSVSLTVPDGGSSFIFSGSVRPFVIGFIPVVGGGGAGVVSSLLLPHMVTETTAISPVRQALNQIERGAAPPLVLDGSSRLGFEEFQDEQIDRMPVGSTSTAEQGDISVAEIRRQHARQDQKQERVVLSLLKQAREAKAKGKLNVAKIYYRIAVRSARGDRKSQILDQLRSLAE